MFATFAFITANWQWIMIGGAATLALGYLAFIARNWKAALGAAVIIALGLGAHALFTAGVKHEVNRRLKIEHAELLRDLKMLNDMVDTHNQRVDADAATIAELRRLANETPPNSNVCIDRLGAGRLRNIR